MNTNNPTVIILAVCAMLVVIFVFALIWASRYVKVGPDQALIISGRQIQTPDGKRVGFRIIIGGGTFVLPVIEKAEVLSLEIFPIELNRIRARTSDKTDVELDCSAQLKIKNEPESIVMAAQHFLHKSKSDLQVILAPILEKSFNTAIAATTFEDLEHNPTATAARMETEASAPLTRMGLFIVSLKTKNVRSS
jgi:flotillin